MQMTKDGADSYVRLRSFVERLRNANDDHLAECKYQVLHTANRAVDFLLICS